MSNQNIDFVIYNFQPSIVPTLIYVNFTKNVNVNLNVGVNFNTDIVS